VGRQVQRQLEAVRVADQEHPRTDRMGAGEVVQRLEDRLRLVPQPLPMRQGRPGASVAGPVEREDAETQPGTQVQQRQVRVRPAVEVARRHAAAVQREHHRARRRTRCGEQPGQLGRAGAQQDRLDGRLLL
jgi:hypothetical protein